jgi:hypothetical protein
MFLGIALQVFPEGTGKCVFGIGFGLEYRRKLLSIIRPLREFIARRLIESSLIKADDENSLAMLRHPVPCIEHIHVDVVVSV